MNKDTRHLAVSQITSKQIRRFADQRNIFTLPNYVNENQSIATLQLSIDMSLQFHPIEIEGTFSYSSRNFYIKNWLVLPF